MDTPSNHVVTWPEPGFPSGLPDPGKTYASERARLIFDIRPEIPPVQSKTRADVSSDFTEGNGIGVEWCLVWMWPGRPQNV